MRYTTSGNKKAACCSIYGLKLHKTALVFLRPLSRLPVSLTFVKGRSFHLGGFISFSDRASRDDSHTRHFFFFTGIIDWSTSKCEIVTRTTGSLWVMDCILMTSELSPERAHVLRPDSHDKSLNPAILMPSGKVSWKI